MNPEVPPDGVLVRVRVKCGRHTGFVWEKVLFAGGPPMTFGTDTLSDVYYVTFPGICRRHFKLELDPLTCAVVLYDTSIDGTFVEGVRVRLNDLAHVVQSGEGVLFIDPKLVGIDIGYTVWLCVGDNVARKGN